jgi:hypothetical protein
MRYLVLALLVACSRGPSLGGVDAPNGWKRVASDELLLNELGVEYRERKTAHVDTFEGPGGEQLRVIRLDSRYSAMHLLSRLTNRLGAYRIDTVGDLTIDALDTDNGHHVGFEIQAPPSDDPDKVTRGQIMLASCTAPLGPPQKKDPCMQAVAGTIAELRDEADGSWIYWYVAALAFASIIIGRQLLIGRRLLPPKGPGGLPVARVR